MLYKASNPYIKRRGLGLEDALHKKFAALLRGYESLNLLKATWWSYDASGENRTIKTGSLLKAKGLNPGKSDYEFKYIKEGITHLLYLEFKTLKGKQSSNQIKFEALCIGSNEDYYIVRSVDEALKILEKHGIIKGR